MGMFTGYKKAASALSQKRSGLRVSFAFFCAELSSLNANPKLLIGKAVFNPDNIGKQTVDVTFEHPLQSIPFAIMAIYNDTISVVDYMGVLNVVKDSVTKKGFQVSTKRLAAEYNWEITYVVYY